MVQVVSVSCCLPLVLSLAFTGFVCFGVPITLLSSTFFFHVDGCSFSSMAYFNVFYKGQVRGREKLLMRFVIQDAKK